MSVLNRTGTPNMREPALPLLSLINEHRQRIYSALPTEALSVTADDPKWQPARTARTGVNTFFASWDRIITRVRGLSRELDQVRSQAARLTTAALEEDLRNTVTPARDDTSREIATMREQADQLRIQLTAASQPPRPQPIDATQVALVEEHRAAWRMVLDRLPSDDVVDRLERFVIDSADDPLKIWSLGSDWPALYLESRGIDPAYWTATAPRLLAPYLPASAKLASELLASISSHRYGLHGLAVTAASWVDMALDELATGAAVTLPPEQRTF